MRQINKVLKYNALHHWHNNSNSPSKHTTMKTTTPFKIFTVDDDLFTAHLLRQLLQQQGYDDVTVFASGVAMLHELHQKPQVILLDHQMDDLDGFETLKKIKRFDPNVFVVMVSAQEDMQTALNTLRYGALDYLAKNNNMAHDLAAVMTRIEDIAAQLRQKRPSLLNQILSTIL